MCLQTIRRAPGEGFSREDCQWALAAVVAHGLFTRTPVLLQPCWAGKPKGEREPEARLPAQSARRRSSRVGPSILGLGCVAVVDGPLSAGNWRVTHSMPRGMAQPNGKLEAVQDRGSNTRSGRYACEVILVEAP